MTSPINDAWSVAVPQAKARFDQTQATPERAAVDRLFEVEGPHEFRERGRLSFQGDLAIAQVTDDSMTVLPLSIDGEAVVFTFEDPVHETEALIRWSPNRATEWFRPNCLANGTDGPELLLSRSAFSSTKTVRDMAETTAQGGSPRVIDLAQHGSALYLSDDSSGRTEWIVGVHAGEPVALFTAMDRENTTYTVRPPGEDEALIAAIRSMAASAPERDLHGYSQCVEEDLQESGGIVTPEIRGMLHYLAQHSLSAES